MADIVITEFMDEAAVADLAARRDTLYDPGLVDRPADLLAAARDCRALVVRNRTQVRGELLAAAQRLVVVGRLGVGLDNIDIDACAARGVVVRPATGANDVSVAEYVIASAMLLLRGAYRATPDVVAGLWPRNALMNGREISGKRLGLIGFGSIARETARRAGALGMSIVAHDPFVPTDAPIWGELGARPESLDALLAASDVVSLHVPLTDQTRSLLDAAAIARMARGAILINAARGGVVDEPALAEALRAGRIGGAALDVFDAEPLPAEKAAVFAGCPNLILTPHIAGLTEEANGRVSSLTAANVLHELDRAGA
ncbi:hydroxyacid dehydrogenase [Alsobacter sp. KACC 23698]|uniref:Hydroxyacid dehydrogenase n=1 Tax=Alsobacter sp. KACC 23698 TaxID=3149229 RepID=A0AAU7JIE9_9HYPH